MTAEFTGSLREALVVEHWQPAPDDSGGDAGEWAAGGYAWGALVPAEGASAPVVGERRVLRPRFRLTLRPLPEMSLMTRFRWRERVLVVLRIEPDPRARDRLILLVEDRT